LTGCTKIELIDAYRWNVSNSTMQASIKILILRDTLSISTASVSLSTLFSDATIYVPQDLLNDYKSATNWSAIADQIVALEGTKYEQLDWWETEDWFLNMYHYTSVLDEEESEE